MKIELRKVDNERVNILIDHIIVGKISDEGYLDLQMECDKDEVKLISDNFDKAMALFKVTIKNVKSNCDFYHNNILYTKIDEVKLNNKKFNAIRKSDRQLSYFKPSNKVSL